MRRAPVFPSKGTGTRIVIRKVQSYHCSWCTVTQLATVQSDERHMCPWFTHQSKTAKGEKNLRKGASTGGGGGEKGYGGDR